VDRSDRVPSPGAWQPPPGTLPGWNWIPPEHGLSSRLDRVPRWVRVWYKTPFVDRYAHSWMWHHGGWDIIPDGSKADSVGLESPESALPGRYYRRTGIPAAFNRWAHGTEHTAETPWIGSLLSRLHMRRLAREERCSRGNKP
jgi:hypothetical protein